MLIRLFVACGLLVTANHVSAQYTCGSDCTGADGGHTAGSFGQSFAVPQTQQSHRYNRRLDPPGYGASSYGSSSYGSRAPYPQDTRSDRGAQSGYSASNRQQPFGYGMIQSQAPGMYEQQPRSPRDAQQGERGHQRGGSCSHRHMQGQGHSHSGDARSRGRRESAPYRDAPGGGGLPRNEQPIPSDLQPSDLQPMEKPSLPPAHPMQSRIERYRLPDSSPSRSRADSMRSLHTDRSDYINI